MSHPTDDEPPINLHLSAEIDRATSQMEVATDPAVRAAWRRVLDFYESLQPPGIGEAGEPEE